MPEDPGLLGRTVLVAEDSGMIALEIQELVQALGCTVLGPAANVAQAMALLDGVPPDAALLNVQLEPLSAVPIAEVLRATGVPFAVVTGYARHDLAAEPVWRGVPYLAKPFSERELQALVRELVAGPEADGCPQEP
jgi:DNA-binding response OmpR family regulator